MCPLWKNKALNLTEEEIRYVMGFTKSNAEASRFIGCNIATYERYAKRYFDKETGKSLWDLHKNQAGKGIHLAQSAVKPNSRTFKKADIFDILEGKYPAYDRRKLAKRLLDECVFAESCSNCGFDERRITDYTVPLILTWQDGDLKNHKQDNLKFLCYNCYYLTYDDLVRKTDAVVSNFKGFH